MIPYRAMGRAGSTVLIVSFALAACARSEGVTELGLVASYSMEGGAGSGLFVDGTGRGLDGLCSAQSCPERSPGRSGTAISVDGSQYFLIAGAPLSDALWQGFTIAVWARRTGGTTPLAKPQVAGPGASYELVWKASEIWFCTDGDPAPTGEECMVHDSALTGWHHFALVWDGTTKSLAIDGARVASAPAQTVFDDTDMVVGSDREDGDPSTPFEGQLDDLRIYGRPLSAAELRRLATR